MGNRTKGLGGTDIGAIIGVNPWKNKMDVYLEKVGITEPIPDNENMYWGREMEPALAKRYDKETGYETWIPRPEILPLSLPGLPWYLGSPDGLIDPLNTVDGGLVSTGGVDFKTTGSKNGYGEPWSDEVPEYIACQAHWYMGLTGAEWWDIATLFMGYRREFAIFHLKRNQVIIDNLVEAGRDFWENHVVPRVPPEIDASEASKTLLNHLYPANILDLIAADNEAESVAENLRQLSDEYDEVDRQYTLSQNKLKAIIGEHEGVVTSLGKITWKKNKARQVVDWYDAFYSLANIMLGTNPQEINLDDIINTCTITKPGPRVFRAWWKKEEA
jgi:putative phage-type endonuclease